MVLLGEVCATCGRRLPETPESKLNRLVDRSGGPEACWPWVGHLHVSGYGLLHYFEDRQHHTVRAHRLAYELVNGPIPEGLILLHACDNRRCCNPAHLSIGTHGENIADMWSKGRQQDYRGQARGARASKSGLTDDTALEMRARFRAGENAAQLGRAYGISQAAAWNVIHGVTWTHLPGAVPKRGRGRHHGS